jgi:4a-hydroxytetrahydrobiopterin dehydratase
MFEIDPREGKNPEAQTLSPKELKSALGGLQGWSVERGALHREYVFQDFVEAFGFMASAALHAQAMDHHPDWSNSYKTVKVDLVTHDAGRDGGITGKDVALAERMEALARRLLPTPKKGRGQRG